MSTHDIIDLAIKAVYYGFMAYTAYKSAKK